QGVFEMTKVRFDAPTLAVEPSDVRFGITFRVEQRGRQGDDAGAAAALGDHETKFAHHQRVGQHGEVRFSHPGRSTRWFSVFDQLIVPSQSPKPTGTRQTALLLVARTLRGRAAMPSKVDDLALVAAKQAKY